MDRAVPIRTGAASSRHDVKSLFYNPQNNQQFSKGIKLQEPKTADRTQPLTSKPSPAVSYGRF